MKIRDKWMGLENCEWGDTGLEKHLSLSLFLSLSLSLTHTHTHTHTHIAFLLSFLPTLFFLPLYTSFSLIVNMIISLARLT
jgi:hypothetical protein